MVLLTSFNRPEGIYLILHETPHILQWSSYKVIITPGPNSDLINSKWLHGGLYNFYAWPSWLRQTFQSANDTHGCLINTLKY